MGSFARSEDHVNDVLTGLVNRLGRDGGHGLRLYPPWRARNPDKDFADWIRIVTVNVMRRHVREQLAPARGGEALPSRKRLLNEFSQSPAIEELGMRPPVTAAQTAQQLLVFAQERLPRSSAAPSPRGSRAPTSTRSPATSPSAAPRPPSAPCAPRPPSCGGISPAAEGARLSSTPRVTDRRPAVFLVPSERRRSSEKEPRLSHARSANISRLDRDWLSLPQRLGLRSGPHQRRHRHRHRKRRRHELRWQRSSPPPARAAPARWLRQPEQRLPPPPQVKAAPRPPPPVSAATAAPHRRRPPPPAKEAPERRPRARPRPRPRARARPAPAEPR